MFLKQVTHEEKVFSEESSLFFNQNCLHNSDHSVVHDYSLHTLFIIREFPSRHKIAAIEMFSDLKIILCFVGIKTSFLINSESFLCPVG